MESLFSLDNLFTLMMLTLLQAVLGIDNLLYISLESRRAPLDKQAAVRRMGIALAVILRIVLLFVLLSLIGYFKDPFLSLNLPGFVESEFNVHSIIVLLGGVFIIYTATKEIMHMMSVHDPAEEVRGPRPVWQVVFWIVAMNLVFSFDSILSAIALTDVFWVMATAIMLGGALMIWLADRVAEFLRKNRMYEVLGLFILFVVGIMLLTEGAHLAHLKLFDSEILPMSKATFYFVIGVLVLTDVVQTRYRNKLTALAAASSQKVVSRS